VHEGELVSLIAPTALQNHHHEAITGSLPITTATLSTWQKHSRPGTVDLVRQGLAMVRKDVAFLPA